MSSDELIDAAERHLADDHARDETLEAARRYAEALAGSPEPLLRVVAAELAQIVGAP